MYYNYFFLNLMNFGELKVRFVVDEVTTQEVSRQVLRFSPANHHLTIAPQSSSPPHEMCDSPDQAAHYHILGPKLRASSLTRHLVVSEKR
jgi:hypothetical protein